MAEKDDGLGVGPEGADGEPADEEFVSAFGEAEPLAKEVMPPLTEDEQEIVDDLPKASSIPAPEETPTPSSGPLDSAVADPTMSLANMNMIRRRDVRMERMKRGLPVNTLGGLTKKEYVEREVEITRAQIKAGITPNMVFGDRDNVDRSRAYAEWRWDAFQRGEVSSL